ncbi:hypothetical protein FFLO_06618 [Filobasidium floriforme]|uniref:Eukaryotic translation initiation factor 3 subunit L n=1 Tax=Filobasidium floriforme TaxID=5210 RepID=A0A8K0JEK5_9TREE|nr:hypothetical protein FFLO_06618 [Filobasidium floriforme]
MSQAFYDDPESLLPEPSAYQPATSADLDQRQGQYQEYIDEHGLTGAGVPQEDDGEEERERLEGLKSALEQVPDEVKKFIQSFHQAILNNDTPSILSMYESGWNRITQQYYSNEEWPEGEVVAGLVGGDQLFLTLYRELYFRHVYAKLEPNVDDRFQSYENICELFNLLLNSEQPVPLDLPIQWLWDMLDEFVYQFQSFAQWRSVVKNKSEDELAMLAENPQIWSCYSVLNVLYSLVQKSQINEQLVAEKNGSSPEEVAEIAGDYGSKPLYRNLGYFSLICLLRVHTLLGDPTLALQTMQNMDLSNNSLLTKITACHVTTYYHVGFAYMALGRYPDAIKIFVSVLIFFNRMKQYHTRSYQYGSIAKQCERMYALLAVCTTLSPGPSDDGIMNTVKERYGEQLTAMQSGKEETAIPAFRELFLGASPKFLSPVSPPYEDHDSLAAWVSEPPQDALVRQTDLFIQNVQVQLGVSTMRSFLKLYTSIDATKLANFLDEDEDTVLERMMSLKSASRSYGHKQGEGSLLDGERFVTNNLDFFIDGSMVQVAETTTNRRFAGFFIRNAENANRVFETIKNAPLPIPRSAQSGGSGQQQQQQQQQRPGGAGGQRTGGQGKGPGGAGGAPRTGGVARAPGTSPWAR